MFKVLFIIVLALTALPRMALADNIRLLPAVTLHVDDSPSFREDRKERRWRRPHNAAQRWQHERWHHHHRHDSRYNEKRHRWTRDYQAGRHYGNRHRSHH